MSLINSTSKTNAIIISYIALLFNTLSAISLTPLLLKKLGVDDFGLYQMILTKIEHRLRF